MNGRRSYASPAVMPAQTSKESPSLGPQLHPVLTQPGSPSSALTPRHQLVEEMIPTCHDSGLDSGSRLTRQVSSGPRTSPQVKIKAPGNSRERSGAKIKLGR